MNALEQISQLLNHGNFAKAHELIRSFRRATLDRRRALQLAMLARRAGLAETAVRLLNPIVRLRLSGSKASPKEMAVYAGALVKLGAIEESLELLERVDGGAAPEKYLFQAHAYMGQWEYRLAIVPLLSYLATQEISEEERLIGMVNLAAAWVHEDHYAEAEAILAELEAGTESSYRVLYANTLELGAQLAIKRGQWHRAEEKLQKSNALIGDTNTMDGMFIHKWLVVLSIHRDGFQAPLREALQSVRETAAGLRHWESVRDCDLILSTASQDAELFRHVYFGTPNEAFRRLALLRFQRPIDIPSHFVRALGTSPNDAPLIDLDELCAPGSPLKQGSVASRLLTILASDFYRPLRVGSLHGKLYRSEFFNPESSPARVRQAAAALRRALLRYQIPLTVVGSSEGYRLEPRPICRVRVPRRITLPDEDEIKLAMLREHFSNRPFSTREAGRVLGLAPRTIVRWLSHTVAVGLLTTFGKANATQYAFPQKKAQGK